MELFSVIKKLGISYCDGRRKYISFRKKHFTSKEAEEGATKMKKLKEKIANNYKD